MHDAKVIKGARFGIRQSEKYPPEAFIVPGQDNNGNSIRVWCRVMPLLDRAAEILFASRKFPFQSKGDLIRWCIKVGVDRLNEMEPVAGSVMVQSEAMIKILTDEMSHHSFSTVFNTMAASVGLHLQARALGEARRVVSEMIGIIQAIDNDYWRGRYLSEIDTKFGYLLKGTKGAALGDHVDSGPGIDEGED